MRKFLIGLLAAAFLATGVGPANADGAVSCHGGSTVWPKTTYVAFYGVEGATTSRLTSIYHYDGNVPNVTVSVPGRSWFVRKGSQVSTGGIVLANNTNVRISFEGTFCTKSIAQLV